MSDDNPDDLEEVAEHIERVLEAMEDEGSRYIDMMFAAYLRTFGGSFGNDPEAFLLDLAWVTLTMPDGRKAGWWASKKDLFDEADDDDGGDAFSTGSGGRPVPPMGTRLA